MPFRRQRDERRGVDLGGLCQTHLVLVERFAVREVFDQFGDELLLLSCGRTVIWDKLHPLPGRDVAKVSGGPAGAFDIGTLAILWLVDLRVPVCAPSRRTVAAVTAVFVLRSD